MNLKNHTGLRPIVLQADGSQEPAFAHGANLQFSCKTLPATTGKLANYLVGFLVTVVATYVDGRTSGPALDWDDVARGLFESFELRNSIIGKPISHNYYRGEFVGLGGFVGNGMQRPIPHPPGFPAYQNSTAHYHQRMSFFVPACSMLGMKGHHTAQLACLFDGATFEVKCAAASVLGSGFTISNATVKCTALLLADAEVRVGPAAQFVRYARACSASGTAHTIEGLGESSSLVGVEPGAGIAFLAWLSSNRGLGGSWSDGTTLEYVNFPARGLDQLIHLDALYADYIAACGGVDHAVNADVLNYTDSAFHTNGGSFGALGNLYPPTYSGAEYGIIKSNFVPLISPKRFMEVTKLQQFQGAVDLYAKSSSSFSGDDVFLALQYHSWTAGQHEQIFKAIVSKGVADAVWGMPNLVPKSKIMNKQPAGGMNPAKTRFLPITYVPQTQVTNPPAPGK